MIINVPSLWADRKIVSLSEKYFHYGEHLLRRKSAQENSGRCATVCACAAETFMGCTAGESANHKPCRACRRYG